MIRSTTLQLAASVHRLTGRHASSQDKQLQSAPRNGLPLAAMLFILSLAFPLIMHVGPLRLSPYRIVLLAALIPCLVLWLSGRIGPKLLADWCVLGISAWSALSLAVNHGTQLAIEAGGIIFVETAGAWFLARATIRTPEAFRAMVRLLFVFVLILLPIAVFEATTGRYVSANLFGLPTAEYGQRLGLDRARGLFEHPILFGVVCGGIIGMTYHVLGYGRTWLRRAGQAALVFVTGAFSLSAGPLISMSTQIGLLIWGGLMSGVRKHWHLLAGLSVLAYIVVDLLSNRTPIKVFIHYLSFSAHTAYNRLLIWEFGTQNILDNPVFGIGLNDWERPSWMPDSVDMFWILPAMRHGVLVWIFYFLWFFSITVAVARRRNLDRRLAAYRMGYMVSMAGFFTVGWGVHFWNASFVYFMFLLGSGAWLIEAKNPSADFSRAQLQPERPRRRTWL